MPFKDPEKRKEYDRLRRSQTPPIQPEYGFPIMTKTIKYPDKLPEVPSYYLLEGAVLPYYHLVISGGCGHWHYPDIGCPS